MNFIRRCAARYNFREFLGSHPLRRPDDLPVNSPDRDIYHRQQRQARFDEQNGKFIQALADVTTGSGYDAVVSRYLTDRRPLKALKKLRDQLLTDAGHKQKTLRYVLHLLPVSFFGNHPVTAL